MYRSISTMPGLAEIKALLMFGFDETEQRVNHFASHMQRENRADQDRLVRLFETTMLQYNSPFYATPFTSDAAIAPPLHCNVSFGRQNLSNRILYWASDDAFTH